MKSIDVARFDQAFANREDINGVISEATVEIRLPVFIFSLSNQMVAFFMVSSEKNNS